MMSYLAENSLWAAYLVKEASEDLGVGAGSSDTTSAITVT